MNLTNPKRHPNYKNKLWAKRRLMIVWGIFFICALIEGALLGNFLNMASNGGLLAPLINTFYGIVIFLFYPLVYMYVFILGDYGYSFHTLCVGFGCYSITVIIALYFVLIKLKEFKKIWKE